MAIHSLTVCRWVGSAGRDRNVLSPAWPEVEAAIRALDGDEFNDLYLFRDEDPELNWLSVGGGAGRYLVTGAGETGFPTVADLSRSRLPDELLCVGGQGGWYPARWIQSLEVALAAARHFHGTGEFGGGLFWELA